MSVEGPKKETSVMAILLFGILSMVFGQVFYGSSPLWFLDFFGWSVLFPLVWFQSLLLINIALYYERTSLTQLYLLGIIYGLYEAWITKVVWAGYLHNVPVFGTFLGFAIAEFLIKVLFWHPVFSFIIPVIIFQIIIQETNKGEAAEIYTSHLRFMSNNIQNKVLLGVVVVIGALFLIKGLEGNALAILVAAGINFAFIFLLGYLTISLSKRPLSLDSLKVGKRGLSIISIYLIAIYSISFLTVNEEMIASIGTILLTVVFYIIVLTMLFLTPRDLRTTIELPSGIIRFEQLTWALVTFLMLSLTFALISIIAFIASSLFYILLIFLGPILFFLAIVQVFRKGELIGNDTD